MYLLRALAVWIVIILVETVHGIVREAFLKPLMGDFRARQIAVFTGMLLILVVVLFFTGWLAAANAKERLIVGLLWVVLTVGFELGLGLAVLGLSRERLFEDYDISRGGLMGIGLLFLLLVPLIAAKISASQVKKVST